MVTKCTPRSVVQTHKFLHARTEKKFGISLSAKKKKKKKDKELKNSSPSFIHRTL